MKPNEHEAKALCALMEHFAMSIPWMTRSGFYTDGGKGVLINTHVVDSLLRNKWAIHRPGPNGSVLLVITTAGREQLK